MHWHSFSAQAARYPCAIFWDNSQTCSSPTCATLETPSPEITVPAPWCTSNISGAPSGYCHPLASLLYLPGHGQSPYMVFCLFLTSPWVRSSFQYLTLPVEPRTLTQFSSNNDPLLCARCHAGHEIKDRACSLLLRNWQLNGISAFSEMDHASRSHDWEGRATSAPLLTPLQIDTAHPPYSSLPKWSKKWVEHDSAHTVNLHGVD